MTKSRLQRFTGWYGPQLFVNDNCAKISNPKIADNMGHVNSADSDQTAPGGAV